MAHFAKIGMNGKVIQVTTMDNEVMKDADGNDVTVLDYVVTRSVDEAIAEAESRNKRKDHGSN